MKGTSLNSSGKVLDIARLANPLFDEYLSANVEENAGRRCHVEVGLSAEGTMAYMTCDCPGFRPDSGACRHIVALLVHKYYEDMGGRTYSAAPAGKGPARSDDAARRMVETYLDQRRWNQMSLHNIARSGIFAADRAVAEYAEHIWHVPHR